MYAAQYAVKLLLLYKCTRSLGLIALVEYTWYQTHLPVSMHMMLLRRLSFNLYKKLLILLDISFAYVSYLIRLFLEEYLKFNVVLTFISWYPVIFKATLSFTRELDAIIIILLENVSFIFLLCLLLRKNVDFCHFFSPF